MLQVEVIKKNENLDSFMKYEVGGYTIYFNPELELTDEIEIIIIYSIPLLGTKLGAKGVSMNRNKEDKK